MLKDTFFIFLIVKKYIENTNNVLVCLLILYNFLTFSLPLAATSMTHLLRLNFRSEVALWVM